MRIFICSAFLFIGSLSFAESSLKPAVITGEVEDVPAFVPTPAPTNAPPNQLPAAYQAPAPVDDGDAAIAELEAEDKKKDDKKFDIMDFFKNLGGGGGAGTGSTSPGAVSNGSSYTGPSGSSNSSFDQRYDDSGSSASNLDYVSSLASQGRMEESSACGSKDGNMWTAAMEVTEKKVIPERGGYDIKNASGRPKLRTSGGKVVVEFSPGTASHCSSATYTAFAQYCADLINSGAIDNPSALINYVNSPGIDSAFLGNTYSVAFINQQLGGYNMLGTKSKGNIADVLKQAKPGDILKFDRSNGTGHSTVFQKFDGTNVCFWSSNKGTSGPGIKCENVSNFVDCAVSRMPTPGALNANLKNGAPNPSGAYGASSGSIKWNESMVCSNGAVGDSSSDGGGTSTDVDGSGSSNADD